MEFLDEYESRPRFLFQSKQFHQPSGSDRDPQSSSLSTSFLSSVHKPTFFASILASVVIFTLAFLYANFEPLQSLLLWLSLSLLIGPFAPPSLTAGDIRVGVGSPLKEEVPDNSTESNEKSVRKWTKTRKKVPEDAEGYSRIDGSIFDSSVNEFNRSNDSSNSKKSEEKFQEQSEWSEADDELLRKLMGKHPVGKPGRWEAIAEGFKGKFKVETIISKSKEMGERKVSDQDSYMKFLKDRKPVDKRVIDEGGNEAKGDPLENVNQNSEGGKTGWSSAEDLALLNALKTFPKDVAMRWEKIAASLPGKSKSACMKRMTELKKDFRSSKASSGQAA